MSSSLSINKTTSKNMLHTHIQYKRDMRGAIMTNALQHFNGNQIKFKSL